MQTISYGTSKNCKRLKKFLEPGFSTLSRSISGAEILIAAKKKAD